MVALSQKQKWLMLSFDGFCSKDSAAVENGSGSVQSSLCQKDAILSDRGISSQNRFAFMFSAPEVRV